MRVLVAIWGPALLPAVLGLWVIASTRQLEDELRPSIGWVLLEHATELGSSHPPTSSRTVKLLNDTAKLLEGQHEIRDGLVDVLERAGHLLLATALVTLAGGLYLGRSVGSSSGSSPAAD